MDHFILALLVVLVTRPSRSFLTNQLVTASVQGKLVSSVDGSCSLSIVPGVIERSLLGKSRNYHRGRVRDEPETVRE